MQRGREKLEFLIYCCFSNSDFINALENQKGEEQREERIQATIRNTTKFLIFNEKYLQGKEKESKYRRYILKKHV